MDGREILEQYVTNLDGQVFAIQNLQGMVGAVMARYSRAEGGLRETLLREFVKEDQLNPKKASRLIERVLIAYGDDSVGELEGAHLSFENISMLATKVIEHRRIGGSPIEQSTRYIRYDFQNGQNGYHYYLPGSLEGEGIIRFREQMDGIFGNYSKMWRPLNDFLVRMKPIGEAVYDFGEVGSRYADMETPKQKKAFERTYRNDIKTKACDLLRAFLPLATKANVGLFGNGRFFQHLISKLLSSPLKEANGLGEKALHELSKIIPHYVKRARVSQYLQENDSGMTDLARRYFSDLKTLGTEITLVEPDYDFMVLQTNGASDPKTMRNAYLAERSLNFLTALVYGYTHGSFSEIRDHIKSLPATAHEEIMNAYYGVRKTRRDRPERGIEHGYPYTFDLVTEWAVYKDLMRHRMGTIQIQSRDPSLGFEMPEEIVTAGLEDVARDTLARAEDLFAYLDRTFPSEREYAILQGHRVRWLLGMNDRALMHMLELRTAPQGHVNYRKACQTMHRLVASRFPDRAERMSFVNHENIFWARGDSEARQRVKEDKLESTPDA